MAGNAAQGIAFAVEDEALIGIDLKAAAAEAGGNIVQNFLILHQVYFHAVQVGILAAVPQLSVFDGDVDLGLVGSDVGNGVALGIQHGVLQVLAHLGVLQEHFHFHIGILAFHNGGHLDAGAAEVVQIEVAFGYAQDVHITVNAAVEGEVCHLGIHPVVGGVVHQDHQHIFPLHRVGHVHTPGGVAAVVMGQVLAVEVSIGRGVGTVDLQVVAVGGGQIQLVEALGIHRRAAVVIVAAVLAVNGVPAVGQVHPVPFGADLGGDGVHALGKGPFVVKIDNIAHSFPPKSIDISIVA